MIICVCQAGHSRSVALTRLFHQAGREAVAIGWETSPRFLKERCIDLDTRAICLLDRSFRQYIPREAHPRIVDFHVGPDQWSNPYHPGLRQLLIPMVARFLKIPESTFGERCKKCGQPTFGPLCGRCKGERTNES